MYDKYAYSTLITPSPNTRLAKHKAVMLINNVASHGSNPADNSFLVINKSGNTGFYSPTSPSNAVKPFTIIPVQMYSYNIAVASTVSVYLLN
jgi:hypothetical protein